MIYGTGSRNRSETYRTACIRHRPDGSRNPPRRPRRLRSVNRSHPHQETHEVAPNGGIYQPNRRNVGLRPAPRAAGLPAYRTAASL